MWKAILKTVVIIFAIIGLIFSGVFVAVRLGLTNVKGSIDSRNKFFTDAATSSGAGSGDVTNLTTDNQILCSIHALAKFAPETADRIQFVWETTGNLVIVQNMLNAAMVRFVDTTSIASDYRSCASVVAGATSQGASATATAYSWAESPEWQVIASGLAKDHDQIIKAANAANVSPRMVVSLVIAEQFRFFTSDRDSYKKYFEPLKILGTLSQFSLGVSGIKPDTATVIENNLKDSSSSFYPGPNYQSLLDYAPTDNHDTVLYNRLTDTSDHYYQYLYTALFIKEIETEWKNAGYPLDQRPEIITTLFNLGFAKSVPKPDPVVAGTIITIGTEQYTFGRLGYEFYFSGEMVDQFPF